MAKRYRPCLVGKNRWYFVFILFILVDCLTLFSRSVQCRVYGNVPTNNNYPQRGNVYYNLLFNSFLSLRLLFVTTVIRDFPVITFEELSAHINYLN